jgi:hypothetical protein
MHKVVKVIEVVEVVEATILDTSMVFIASTTLATLTTSTT